jgi:hypothetical protein
MAYKDFTTLTKVREAFGLTIEESINLFTDTPEVLPSSHLQLTLNENVFLATAINTEKARAELIIAPVLLEVISCPVNHLRLSPNLSPPMKAC